MYNSLKEVQHKLYNKNLQLEEVVKFYLGNIYKHNKEINAFLEIFEEEALEKSKIIQKKILEKKAGKLAGLVVGIKDNICYKDHKLSASSKILENFTSLFSATVVERMLKEDAIIIGRLNCDEFAMGSSNENSAFGNVKNPLDKTRVTGGSSGGSVAAVSADMCMIALGSDTGGSVRQPSSFCNLFGLKTTYGRVSRHGLIAYASSFDQISPMTKNIEDAALVLEVISGKDNFDATASSELVPNYYDEVKNFDFSKKKLKIAYLKETIEHKGLDKEIKNKILNIIKDLKNLGHNLKDIEFPYLDYLVPTYYVLTTAEASSNLARYDGIHYAYRSSKKSKNLKDNIIKTRSEAFGKEVKRRIMTGTFVLSAGYYDAYYSKAQKVRRLIFDKTMDIFKDYDFIILPTTATTAFKFGEKGENPVSMYLEDLFTVHANLAGIPAISVPVGKHSNGMPFGIQIYAPHFHESKMMAFANYLNNL